MNDIERHIDALGRIVLPSNIRNKLGLKTNSKVLIHLEDHIISIIPVEHQCALCGCTISETKKLCLCTSCIKKIKALN